MNRRRTISALWLVSAALPIVGAVAVSAIMLLPLGIAASDQKPPASAPATGPASRQTFSLQALQPLWNLDLRRPLYDPPPVIVAAPVAKPPPLNVRLLGTIIEPGNSLGIFRFPDGRDELRSVGQDAGGAQVLEVHQDRVVVRYHGDAVVLQIQQEGQSR